MSEQCSPWERLHLPPMSQTYPCLVSEQGSVRFESKYFPFMNDADRKLLFWLDLDALEFFSVDEKLPPPGVTVIGKVMGMFNWSCDFTQICEGEEKFIPVIREWAYIPDLPEGVELPPGCRIR